MKDDSSSIEPLPSLLVDRDFLFTLALALELHPKSRYAAPPLEALEFVEWCFEVGGESELFEHFKNPSNAE